jgi:gas vesicle protein
MEKDQGKFLFGLVMGLLIGGFAGLLLAPQPGEETRKKLAESGERLKEAVSELTEKFKKGTLEFSEKIKGDSSKEDESEKNLL